MALFRKSAKQLGIVKERKKGASLQARKARSGWLFVLPFLLGFVLVYLPIIIGSLKYCFHEIDILTGGGYELVWVGLDNFFKAFEDATFVETLMTGLSGLIIDIPTILLFSLFIAILLNQKMIGRAAFRAIFFIPVVLSTGLMDSINLQDNVSDYMGEGGSLHKFVVNITVIIGTFAQPDVYRSITGTNRPCRSIGDIHIKGEIFTVRNGQTGGVFGVIITVNK